MTSAYDKIILLLNSSNALFRIHEHSPVFTMNDVEQKLPFPIEKLLKTVVFRIKGSNWLYAVVRGKDKVDYKKLSKVLGVSRSNVMRPPPEEVERELSLQIGGICPIPTEKNITVIFDESLIGLGVVYCGVGTNNKSLEIQIDDLVRVAKGEIQSIAQDRGE